jgi:uncharacterized protein with PIN domain
MNPTRKCPNCWGELKRLTGYTTIPVRDGDRQYEIHATAWICKKCHIIYLFTSEEPKTPQA